MTNSLSPIKLSISYFSVFPDAAWNGFTRSWNIQNKFYDEQAVELFQYFTSCYEEMALHPNDCLQKFKPVGLDSIHGTYLPFILDDHSQQCYGPQCLFVSNDNESEYMWCGQIPWTLQSIKVHYVPPPLMISFYMDYYLYLQKYFPAYLNWVMHPHFPYSIPVPILHNIVLPELLIPIVQPVITKVHKPDICECEVNYEFEQAEQFATVTSGVFRRVQPSLRRGVVPVNLSNNLSSQKNIDNSILPFEEININNNNNMNKGATLKQKGQAHLNILNYCEENEDHKLDNDSNYLTMNYVDALISFTRKNDNNNTEFPTDDWKDNICAVSESNNNVNICNDFSLNVNNINDKTYKIQKNEINLKIIPSERFILNEEVVDYIQHMAFVDTQLDDLQKDQLRDLLLEFADRFAISLIV